MGDAHFTPDLVLAGYPAAAQIAANESAFNEAPPTSAPSMSG